jgi:hypothetical protein
VPEPFDVEVTTVAGEADEWDELVVPVDPVPCEASSPIKALSPHAEAVKETITSRAAGQTEWRLIILILAMVFDYKSHETATAP